MLFKEILELIDIKLNRTFTKVSGRSVQALDYPKDNQQGTNNITNPGLDPNGFQAIDDDDIPF